jgi:hypothetical protein
MQRCLTMMIDERMEKNGDRKSRWHLMESADMERPARVSGNRPEPTSPTSPTSPKPFGGCLVSLCLASHLHYLHLSRCRRLLNGKPACTGQPPNSPLLLTGLTAHHHHSRSWLAGCTFSGSSRCCSCLLISNPGFTALALLALADQRPFANFVSIKPAPSRDAYTVHRL